MSFLALLTEFERDVLVRYKLNEPDEFAYRVNRQLCADSLEPALDDEVSALDSAVRKGVCDRKVLFRAGCMREYSALVQHSQMTHAGFQSTTTDEGLTRSHVPGPAGCDEPVRLTIRGVQGIAVAQMEQLPEAGGDEGELLLGRNATLTLDGYEEVSDPGRIQREFGFPTAPPPARAWLISARFEGYQAPGQNGGLGGGLDGDAR